MDEWHATRNGERTPFTVRPGSDFKAWWLGECGHEWLTAVKFRTKGQACPFCSNQRVLAGFNDLATVAASVASEWHPTRNGERLPSRVLGGSNSRAWWLCGECSHEWNTTVASRTGAGTGCAQCARGRARGRRVVPQVGRSLAERSAALAAEWHPERNGVLRPDQITYSSAEKVWWRGSECGHEWRAGVDSRYQGAGCSVCAGRTVVAGVNDLASLMPEVANEWHPTRNGSLKPTEVATGSSRSVWWQCARCPHEWQASPATRRTSGCQPCGRKSMALACATPPVGGSLADLFPNVAAEWDRTRNGDWAPETTKPKSNRLVWWRCAAKGHEWRTTVGSRTAGNGCGECSRESGRGTSLVERYLRAHLALHYSGCQSGVVALPRRDGATKAWRCDVVIHRDGAPSVVVEFDGVPWHVGAEAKDRAKAEDLRQQGHVVVRLRAAPLALLHANDLCVPTDLTMHWNAERLCAFVVEHLRSLGVVPDQSPPDGYVVKIDRAIPENNLAAVNPVVASEWHPTRNGELLPTQVTAGAPRKVWWQCSSCPCEWEAVISSRSTADGGMRSGCPNCAAAQRAATLRRPAAGQSLQDCHPDAAQHWHPTRNAPLTAADVKGGSGLHVWWLCAQGHEWSAPVVRRGRCPVCANRKVLEGVNDLSTVAPEVAAEWHPTLNHGLRPTEVTSRTVRRVWWHCRECDTAWEAPVGSRVDGRACPQRRNHQPTLF